MEELGTRTLAAALLHLRNVEGVNFAEVANKSGVNRTTISQYVNQGAKLKPEQEAKLWEVVNEVRKTQPESETSAASTNYLTEITHFETVEHAETIGWLEYVRKNRKMGLLVGYPGSGKTTALRRYAQLRLEAIYIEAWSQMRLSDLLSAIATALSVEIKGNNYRKTQQLINALRGRDDIMIMIDEAEYLRNIDKFETLRKIWDNTQIPIVLCGTQVLENRLLRGEGHENLAQLYRRKVEIKLKGIKSTEAREILRKYNITADAAETLSKIAEDVKHGGMGTFVEILELCLQTANGGKITPEILANAKRYKLMF